MSPWAKEYQVTGPHRIGPGTGGLSIVSGRFNADELDDFVTLYARDELIVFYQTHDGGLDRRDVSYLRQLEPGMIPCLAECSLAVGDLNADGLDDIVVSGYQGVFTYLAEPVIGGFSLATSKVLLESNQIKLADLDGDGDLDLLVAEYDGDVGYMLNNGVGGFEPHVRIPGTNRTVVTVAAGDFNSDGRVDFATARYEDVDAFLEIFTNQGDLTFSRNSRVIYGLGTLAAGDVNNDSRDDLVLSTGGYVVLVYLQDEGGNLAEPLAYNAWNRSATVVIGDVDSDGLNDLTVNHNSWDRVSTYIQKPDMLTLQTPLIPVSNAIMDPLALAIGDFTRDGCADVVVDGSWGYYLFRGIGCQVKDTVDVGLELTASASGARLLVTNKPGSEGAAAGGLRVDFHTKDTYLVFSVIPDGCVRTDRGVRSVFFLCELAPLAPGASRALEFSYLTKTPGSHHVSSRAWTVESRGYDPVSMDNSASADFFNFPRYIGPVTPATGTKPLRSNRESELVARPRIPAAPVLAEGKIRFPLTLRPAVEGISLARVPGVVMSGAVDFIFGNPGVADYSPPANAEATRAHAKFLRRVVKHSARPVMAPKPARELEVGGPECFLASGKGPLGECDSTKGLDRKMP